MRRWETGARKTQGRIVSRESGFVQRTGTLFAPDWSDGAERPRGRCGNGAVRVGYSRPSRQRATQAAASASVASMQTTSAGAPTAAIAGGTSVQARITAAAPRA